MQLLLLNFLDRHYDLSLPLNAMHAVAGFVVGRSNHIPRADLAPPDEIVWSLFPFLKEAELQAARAADLGPPARFIRFLTCMATACVQDLAAVWNATYEGWRSLPFFSLSELQTQAWTQYVAKQHLHLQQYQSAPPLASVMEHALPELTGVLKDINDNSLNQRISTSCLASGMDAMSDRMDAMSDRMDAMSELVKSGFSSIQEQLHKTAQRQETLELALNSAAADFLQKMVGSALKTLNYNFFGQNSATISSNNSIGRFGVTFSKYFSAGNGMFCF
jgi:hypothetical protein